MALLTIDELKTMSVGVTWSDFTSPELETAIAICSDLVTDHCGKEFVAGTYSEKIVGVTKSNGDLLLFVREKPVATWVSAVANLRGSNQTIDLLASTYDSFSSAGYIVVSSTYCRGTFPSSFSVDMSYTTTEAVPESVKYATSLVIANMLTPAIQVAAGASGSTLDNQVVSFRSGKYSEDRDGFAQYNKDGDTSALLTPTVKSILRKFVRLGQCTPSLL